MSFSSDTKEELSKINKWNKETLSAEFAGYMFSGNMLENGENYEFITENEFNIEHFYKILFFLNIDYEPDVRGKCFVAKIDKRNVENYEIYYKKTEGDLKKSFIKGVFLGSGSVNNPEKNYHLEIMFNSEISSEIVTKICEEYGVKFRKIKVNDKYQVYIKESEEISRFLALIGANRAVLKFEDVRVLKDMKNNVNRKVNCETANLNKTIDAALKQIDDIYLLKKKKKFNKLPENLKQIAELRVQNPELSLYDLGKLLEPPIREICGQLQT